MFCFVFKIIFVQKEERFVEEENKEEVIPEGKVVEISDMIIMADQFYIHRYGRRH